MTVSRRSVLRQGFVAAVACVAGPLQAWSANKKNSNNDSARKGTGADSQPLSREAFNKAVGSGFKVSPTSGNGNTVWLRLLSVQDLPALVPVDTAAMDVPPRSTSSVTTSGFMLHFLGTLPKPLPQDTYTFEHPKLGTFPLFIVPEGANGEYIAVINLLK